MYSVISWVKPGFATASQRRWVIPLEINDTHPTLAIPELMRILLDEEGFNWDDAFALVQSLFNYTENRTGADAAISLARDYH